MSTPHDRRSRKRLATRQGISDVATRLFLERGFDAVTVDEIADAADVGRMTVFNHFPRKEDLFFDRDEEVRQVLRDAVLTRAPDVSPIEALHGLVHRLVRSKSPYLRFAPANRAFVETAERSETLKARARQIRDEVAAVVVETVTAGVGRDGSDPDARLAAAMLLATVTVAFMEAHRAYRRRSDEESARATFVTLVDRGIVGLNAALAGTPYVKAAPRDAP